MQARKRHVNLPEYEVYRDQEMLREHCRKNHYVCEFKECQMLVFEDNVVLNEHYNIIHG
jgi:quinol monooxygenase YgiN